jgi:hypothetical protein
MHACSIHNVLSVMPIGDYGEVTVAHAEPVGFTESLLNFMRNMSDCRTALRVIITASLECARDYHQRLAALRSLPDANEQNLITITGKIAARRETVV